MKADELMIGDWVYAKVQVDDTGTEPVYERTPKRVTDLTKGINGIYVEGTSTFAGAEIEPIPLTAEILEKNGFILHLDAARHPQCRYFECADWNVGWCVNLYPVPNCKYFLETSARMERTIAKTTTAKVIEYVHDLQHALMYSEIEKEIVL